MVTYEELVEKLARDMCNAAGENPDLPTPKNPTADFIWQFYRADAKRFMATILEALTYRTKLTGSPGITEWLAASPLVEEERR